MPRVMERRATLVGAKRHTAAGGGSRWDAEVKKLFCKIQNKAVFVAFGITNEILSYVKQILISS